jgi:hypothetical protein
MKKRVWTAVLVFVLCAVMALPAGAAEKKTAAKTYRSELTGEEISTSIRNQRPIAVIVDNETIALPHYNTANADIVYEMVNSLANQRITRLMCVYKDWGNLARTGNIRSTRPTNILIAQEYDAVLLHDGGPFYNNVYFKRYPDHYAGDFKRYKNGKAREFTDYISGGDLVAKKLKSAGLSSTYPKGFDKDHFVFDPDGHVDLKLDGPVSKAGKEVDLSGAFWHNKSKLTYNSKTKTYTYSEYGKTHKDAETNATMDFKNVILQDVTYHQYDKNGYLIYNCIGLGEGWYITEGKAVPILWKKDSESGDTIYIGGTGEQIRMNPGKTYIALIPDDTWDKIQIK